MLKKIIMSLFSFLLVLLVLPTNVTASNNKAREDLTDEETIYITFSYVEEKAVYNEEYGIYIYELQENEKLIMPRRGVVATVFSVIGFYVLGEIINGVFIATTGQTPGQWLADLLTYEPDWGRVTAWYVSTDRVEYYINQYGAQCSKLTGTEVCSFAP